MPPTVHANSHAVLYVGIYESKIVLQTQTQQTTSSNVDITSEISTLI